MMARVIKGNLDGFESELNHALNNEWIPKWETFREISDESFDSLMFCMVIVYGD